jgi:hypothetical protein
MSVEYLVAIGQIYLNFFVTLGLYSPHEFSSSSYSDKVVVPTTILCVLWTLYVLRSFHIAVLWVIGVFAY